MERMGYLTREGSRTRENRTIRELTVNSIRAIEGEGNERKFRISFSSELPYERWWGTEILDHSEGCVDLSRLNEIGCVLFNHNRDKVIGKIIRAWIEDNRGEAEIEFDTDGHSEEIYQKVKSGTLKGISVGYAIDVWEEIAANKTSKDGRFRGPASVAKRWIPYEISVVSVPADPTVGVGRGENENIGHAFREYERQLIVNKNMIGGDAK